MTKYLYDNEDIIAEHDVNGNITTKYIHGLGIDEPLSMEKNGQQYYYHTDGLGSVTEITNFSGTVVQSYQYDSFGNIKSVFDPNFIQPYTFTGREYDSETGTYHYRARTFDQKTGTFISKDPIGFAAGDANLYRYVKNRPTRFVDPWGLWGVSIPWFNTYSKWENSGQPVSSTEVTAVMNDLTVSVGKCFWKQYSVQKQTREVTHNKLYCGYSVVIGFYCKTYKGNKTFEGKECETLKKQKENNAFMVTGHSEADRIGVVRCRNPWTGQDVYIGMED